MNTYGTRIMFDSTLLKSDPTKVPTTCDIIAPYFDGPWTVPDLTAIVKRWPGKPINGISTHGENMNARTFDVEWGDISASDLQRLFDEWIAHDQTRWFVDGARPEVYCSRDTIPSVRVGTGKYRLGSDYYLWVATLDGTQETGPGINACQVWDLGNYDKSIVYDSRFLPNG